MKADSSPARWAWWESKGEAVQVLDEREVWGNRACRVFVPALQSVETVSAEELSDAGSRPWKSTEVTWRAAAGLALHTMSGPDPVVPRRFDIEPLPHQMSALSQGMAGDQVRLLLADEVGLGKTIEAGLIYSELKARGRVRRVIIIAPKGVQLQWVAEMRQRFGEDFARVGPEGIPLDAGIDPWQSFDRVVCSLDAVKPLRRRPGWSITRVEEHNRHRIGALLEAGWDLVVFDEAHHVAGSSGEVARHELARELAARTPNILLLSATPHSGKSEAFGRLLGLLDRQFLSGHLTREEVRPYVVRTEKRSAVDADGNPLFQPRITVLETIPFGDRDIEQRLYEAVTDYVRNSYGRARREGRTAAAFLVLLMQRLASSSTSAIESALERRAAVLAETPVVQLELRDLETEWSDLTGEEQTDALLSLHVGAFEREVAEVGMLLALARRARGAGHDAKALHLLEVIRRITREEGDPGVKVVIFTEFRPTQRMLVDLLDGVGMNATAINGSMSLEERSLAQEAFRESAQVLVSTDAGGEGINLQFAHVVINYDLPWNPMRIEQRIGRVDRIGQRCPVRAYNFVLENSVDARVLQVLDEKLWQILADLGVDKWGDVLQSAAPRIEDLYAQAIIDPAQLGAEAVRAAAETESDVTSGDELRQLITADCQDAFPPVPVADWLGRAAEAYKRQTGRECPPDHVLGAMPEVAPGESLPQVRADVAGIWTLWEVSTGGPHRDCFALFRTETGRMRPDLAETLWLRLASGTEVSRAAPLDHHAWSDLHRMAEEYGYGVVSQALPDGDHSSAVWMVMRLAVRATP